MKVLHISIYPDKGKKHIEAGGVTSYTKNLVNSINYTKEDQVYILCNKIDGQYEKYTEDGINVIRCFDKNYKFIYQIYKEVQSIKPDIIHIQQELSLYGNIFTAYLLQWLVLVLYKYNTIVTLHGVVSIKKIDKPFIKENNTHAPVWLVKLAFLFIYKPLCVFSKSIVVHENVFKDLLIREYSIKAQKIQVIPHGIENFQAIGQKKSQKYLGLPNNKNIVLFMGYLAGYKGLDLLIEGFAKYVREDKKGYLIIGAGKHPKLKNDKNYLSEYRRLQNKAKSLLGKNYRWAGFIKEKEIQYYYSAADLSIYPYTNQLSSSGPMSIAIGFEKPFLASDVFDNFIESKEILFEKNPNRLKDKLVKFFENKEGFLDYIKYLKQERIWTSVGKRTYDLYKSLYL
jgi:glycosyltransferase involved in cell wall biosynthesis